MTTAIYNILIRAGFTSDQATCLIDSTKKYKDYFIKEFGVAFDADNFANYLNNYHKLVVNNVTEFYIHRDDYEKYELYKSESIVSLEINNINTVIDCDKVPINLKTFYINSEIKFTINNSHKLKKLSLFEITDSSSDTHLSFITTIDCEQLSSMLTTVEFARCKIINPHKFANNIEILCLDECYICNETLILPEKCTRLELYNTNICFDKIVFNSSLQSIKIVNQFICDLTNVNLPASLKHANFYDCIIEELPYSLIFHGFEQFVIKNFNTVITNIDGIFFAHEAVIAWYNRINRLENLHTIYNDEQNVHDSTIQKCILQSIGNLMKLPQTVFSTSRHVSHEKHNTYKLSEFDVLLLVENAIATHPKEIQDEIYKILDETIATNQVCLTGRISKIVNVLSGFNNNVVIEFSPSEQLGSLMAIHRRNNTPVDQVILDLKNRGFDESVINTWTKDL